jgi:hypothetical protein
MYRTFLLEGWMFKADFLARMYRTDEMRSVNKAPKLQGRYEAKKAKVQAVTKGGCHQSLI